MTEEKKEEQATKTAPQEEVKPGVKAEQKPGEGAPKPESKEPGKKGGFHKGKRRQSRQPRRDAEKKDDGILEKVVAINRVSKVVTGGKNFSFGALVVVGDGKGKVGFAIGKAREVQDAIKKGISKAKNSMAPVPMKGTTIPHEILGRYGAAKVLLKPASEGTGVISGSAVRAVLECAGIKDILTKSLGSETAINVVRATFQGLNALISEEHLK